VRLDSYCESQEIVRRFTDQASGAILERPGLERALREVGAGRFDLLLVYRVDRLSRSARGLAQILERLDEADVLFRSATEPFDTSSSSGRMMVQLLGVFAEFERATIVERTVAGMERKAERGEWVGGDIPFGYRLDNARHFLVPDPTEAPVVSQTFRRYTERLEGSSALAKWLTERGLRTRQGKPFNVRAVLGILGNRTYLGGVAFRNRQFPAPHEPLVERRSSNAHRRFWGSEARTSRCAVPTSPSTYLPGRLSVRAVASAISVPWQTATAVATATTSAFPAVLWKEHL
jgi:site-specific DNA recombinase